MTRKTQTNKHHRLEKHTPDVVEKI